jgi:hypothetical protein
MRLLAIPYGLLIGVGGCSVRAANRVDLRPAIASSLLGTPDAAMSNKPQHHDRDQDLSGDLVHRASSRFHAGSERRLVLQPSYLENVPS